MSKQKSGGQNRQSAPETASKTGAQDVRGDKRGAKDAGGDVKSGGGKGGGAKQKRKH